MRYSIILLLIFSVVFMFAGCKKDEEISDLEKEVLESGAADNLTDSMAEADTTATEEELAAMTPEKTPEETPSKPAMPIRMETSGFCVQVSASTSYENTYNLVELYAERGYEAYVTEAVIDGETFYRVRIGAFETFEQARQLAMELNDKYSANYWIVAN